MVLSGSEKSVIGVMDGSILNFILIFVFKFIGNIMEHFNQLLSYLAVMLQIEPGASFHVL